VSRVGDTLLFFALADQIPITLIDPNVWQCGENADFGGNTNQTRHPPYGVCRCADATGMRCEEVKMQSETLPFLIWASTVPMHLLPAAPR
jgi:hypothetical protein